MSSVETPAPRMFTGGCPQQAWDTAPGQASPAWLNLCHWEETRGEAIPVASDIKIMTLYY